MIDIIAYGCLAPIPLWGFLWIIYLMYLDSVDGPRCRRCGHRHWGLFCEEVKERVPETGNGSTILSRTKEIIPFIIIFGIGAIFIIIVQFTPY